MYASEDLHNWASWKWQINSLSRYTPVVEGLNRSWHILRINDYDILKAMCMADTKPKKFRLTKYKGFIVKDFSVLDEALKEARTRIEIHKSLATNEFIVIEFARNDYKHAFKQFGDDILQDAYFLFIEAKKSICLKRLKERVTRPLTSDNHYVSSGLFQSYYRKDLQDAPSDLKADYGINDQHILIIDNNGTGVGLNWANRAICSGHSRTRRSKRLCVKWYNKAEEKGER